MIVPVLSVRVVLCSPLSAAGLLNSASLVRTWTLGQLASWGTKCYLRLSGLETLCGYGYA